MLLTLGIPDALQVTAVTVIYIMCDYTGR